MNGDEDVYWGWVRAIWDRQVSLTAEIESKLLGTGI